MSELLRLRALQVLAGGCTLAALAGCSRAAAVTPSASTGHAAGTAGSRVGTPAQRVAATDQLVFRPSTLTVPAGAIVQWTNMGTVPHTVTFETQPTLTDPSLLAPGDTWDVRIDEAGTYFYYCSLHAGMAGKLVVTAATR